MKKFIFFFTLAIAGHSYASGLDCKIHISKSNNEVNLTRISTLLSSKGYKIVKNQKEADLMLVAHSYCSYAEKSKCYQSNAIIEVLDKKTGEMAQFQGVESTMLLEASSAKALENALRNIDNCK